MSRCLFAFLPFLLACANGKSQEDYKAGSTPEDPEGLAGDSDRPFAPTIEDFTFRANELDPETDIREFESELSVALAETIAHVTHTDLLFPCSTEFINDLQYEDETLKLNYVAEPFDLESETCILKYDFEYRIDLTGTPSARLLLLAGDDEFQIELLE